MVAGSIALDSTAMLDSKTIQNQFNSQVNRVAGLKTGCNRYSSPILSSVVSNRIFIPEYPDVPCSGGLSVIESTQSSMMVNGDRVLTAPSSGLDNIRNIGTPLLQVFDGRDNSYEPNFIDKNLSNMRDEDNSEANYSTSLVCPFTQEIDTHSLGFSMSSNDIVPTNERLKKISENLDLK